MLFTHYNNLKNCINPLTFREKNLRMSEIFIIFTY